VPDALFGKEFVLFFRHSCPRVELILQKLGSSSNPFFRSFKVSKFALVGPSLEAKVLLPLMVLAYGVAPHAFSDYFQMSVTQSGKCCQKFYSSIPIIFGDESSVANCIRHGSNQPIISSSTLS
jgi:hypothetical protein